MLPHLLALAEKRASDQKYMKQRRKPDCSSCFHVKLDITALERGI